MTTRIGVVLVTHNSERFIRATWSAIMNQDTHPSKIVIIDDDSTDGTIPFLRAAIASTDVDVEVLPATTTSERTFTRIAQNFTQGVVRLRDCDVIALSDHDDLWYPDRLTSQVHRLEESPTALMLASNARIMGSEESLFETFEVPPDLMTRTPPQILRHVLRHSVATGSASMLRATLCSDEHFNPPDRWLHDRWWSVLAASRSGLVCDSRPVIDYRVDPDQQVGLSSGRQGSHGASRLRSIARDDLRKARQIHTLRGHASVDCADELAWPRLVRTLVR